MTEVDGPFMSLVRDIDSVHHTLVGVQ
uniref:Uncharacterized protein n=1 Tax=Rhizophora mucronata TaxID=61149 RepID=A0A2P2N8S1_RHIMU